MRAWPIISARTRMLLLLPHAAGLVAANCIGRTFRCQPSSTGTQRRGAVGRPVPLWAVRRGLHQRPAVGRRPQLHESNRRAQGVLPGTPASLLLCTLAPLLVQYMQPRLPDP